MQSEHQREHASFIHVAAGRVVKKAGYVLEDIEAFAVTSGPGSYTGLRVGMAAAKGFCYALSKPLIAINTLEVMAKAARDTVNIEKDVLLCPMIDARRMEVFTALYNSDIENIVSPQAIILQKGIFDDYTINRKILFFGSGSEKFKKLETSPNGKFIETVYSAKYLGKLADKAFAQKKFSDMSYSVPDYFKDVHIAPI